MNFGVTREEQRHDYRGISRKKSVITNSKQLTQKKSADSYKEWRQKLEFREARQQILTEMEELRKFQSSTFDMIETKTHRGSEHDFGIIRQSTGTAE